MNSSSSGIYLLCGNQTWLAGKPPNEMEIFLGRSSTVGAFSVAMFDYQRVHGYINCCEEPKQVICTRQKMEMATFCIVTPWDILKRHILK
jgi:hypothetical protein